MTDTPPQLPIGEGFGPWQVGIDPAERRRQKKKIRQTKWLENDANGIKALRVRVNFIKFTEDLRLVGRVTAADVDNLAAVEAAAEAILLEALKKETRLKNSGRPVLEPESQNPRMERPRCSPEKLRPPK